ncbi:hypothetical protein QVD17_37357 [Tagetes erecta]|uniref:Wall-associated receptor kinase galacturonan-binding domain-containing protein n=1 Tax=Tagetes erecta TaxID=13708 RepID=A0AAD8JY36_TARER|nr:hypothetical protein QVD17_37357 [Tagetes erecta]
MKKLYQFYTLLMLLSLSAIDTSTTAPKYAKNGCKDKCGTVRIPYPFGIGANCSVNEWYNIDCNSSTPYLRAVNNLEVLGVDIENQTVTVNTPKISDCTQTNSVNLRSSPFYFSKLKNQFVFEGCGNAVMMEHGSLLTGCSTTCGNDSVSHTNNCLGISCCQTTIPHHLKSYSTNLTGLGGDKPCKPALLVDKDSYLKGRFSIADDNSYVPVSLLWTLSDNDYQKLSCCSSLWSKVEVDLGNGTSVDSWKCNYLPYTELEGTPYLRNGCRYTSIDMEVCVKCWVAGGACGGLRPTHNADGLVIKRHMTCDFLTVPFHHESKSSLSVILGVGISLGVIFLPISLTSSGEHRSLATHFMSAMEEGHVFSIFDATVVSEGKSKDLMALANLAMQCLNLNGKYRPTMKEVVKELETIHTSNLPSAIHTSIRPLMYEDDFSMITYKESSSTFLSL